MNRIDLTGRVAVVTGGARGIGHAIAKRAAASGAVVSLWDKDADRLAQATAELDAASSVALDLTDEAAVRDAAARTEAAHGRIDILDALKGQAPLGLAVLKATCVRPTHEIEGELVTRVRDQIGPVAAFQLAVIVERLPKTRSGKILRGTLRQIADGVPYDLPATIEDASVLDDL